ncbi:sulfurtransferase-like selenium metabolism protein YedF [Enterococcus sp. AD013-P3]|uniref:sulfurtransferase-like selenium metabolism protein YedF n=1 Tax=Enterococcus sp. AD013-P3 TaxID=3411036 RepID=UPI003B937F67
MIRIDALGKPCPIPVIETKKAIKEMGGHKGEIEVLVDNEVALNNIEKLTSGLEIPTQRKKLATDRFTITLFLTEEANVEKSVPISAKAVTTYLVGKKHLGEGDPQLGALLMKSYLYSLTELSEVPTELIFFNEGIFLTLRDSSSLPDLETLVAKGTKIYVCGTCIDFYEKKDELAIGEITNMYAISEMQQKADKAITV